ncbi:hypothetical protein G6F32_013626 [Rhizopus arrhizus]|nr:hypothetical protein G6F32_013626 [Rhizopus arrhizus]
MGLQRVARGSQRTLYSTAAPGRGSNAGTVCWVSAVPLASHTSVSTGYSSLRVIWSIFATTTVAAAGTSGFQPNTPTRP